MCVGLAEVWSRQRDFGQDSKSERLSYLRGKPVPLVRNRQGQLWMVDRHHRLRALLEMDADVSTYGYVIAELDSVNRNDALEALQQRGWLYLHDGRGNGPWAPSSLPTSLLDLQDDPYRSLVWKLKKERLIKPQPLIPDPWGSYHEFRWGTPGRLDWQFAPPSANAPLPSVQLSAHNSRTSAGTRSTALPPLKCLKALALTWASCTWNRFEALNLPQSSASSARHLAGWSSRRCTHD